MTDLIFLSVNVAIISDKLKQYTNTITGPGESLSQFYSPFQISSSMTLGYINIHLSRPVSISILSIE